LLRGRLRRRRLLLLAGLLGLRLPQLLQLALHRLIGEPLVLDLL
jgi:hypothetical protein